MATTTTHFRAADVIQPDRRKRKRPSIARQAYVLTGWTWGATWVTIACAAAWLAIRAAGL
jgi:hypothetical protein